MVTTPSSTPSDPKKSPGKKSSLGNIFLSDYHDIHQNLIDTFLKQEKYIGKKNKGKVSILSDEEKLVLDAQQALADSNQIARLYADIKSLFIPTQDVIHNLQMGYKIDTLLSSYHQDDVMRVIGEAAFCDMLLKRGTLFLDFSNTAGLKEIINSLTPYLDAMSGNKEFIFFFLRLKVEYFLRVGQYENVVKLCSEDSVYEDPRHQPHVKVQLHLREDYIMALQMLRRHDEALALLKDVFHHLGDALLDYPDDVKRFTDLEQDVLNSKGLMLFQSREYVAAEKVLSEALQKNPNNGRAKEILVRMYATVMSQITRPRVLLADRLLQGKILFDLEKYEEAKAVFEHIIEHDYTQEYKDQKEYYSDYTHTIDPAINEAAEYLSRITAIQTPQSPRVFSPSSS